MKMTLKIVVATLAVSLISACTTLSNEHDSGTEKASTNPLTVTGSWQLVGVSIANQVANAPAEPTSMTLNAETVTSGRLFGNAGCNRFFGAYQLDGNTIKIGPIGSTRMACSEPFMSQERVFLQRLERLNSLEHNTTNQLVLFSNDGQLRLFLKPLPEQAQ